jgi:nitrogenase molybdenum-iron protein alpha/beta subunit
MGNIDIEIYMNNFIGFFKKNPDQLKILIGNTNSDDFFSEIKKLAEKNLSEEKEIVPTRQQMIDLLVDMNTNKNKKQISDVVTPFMEHHMGKIIMN